MLDAVDTHVPPPEHPMFLGPDRWVICSCDEEFASPAVKSAARGHLVTKLACPACGKREGSMLAARPGCGAPL